MIHYIKCHGSGNHFIMVDAVSENIPQQLWSRLSVQACDKQALDSDGLIVLDKDSEGRYGMVMFNPDGSYSRMCGNGIRCIARLAQDYEKRPEFTLFSGNQLYHVQEQTSIFASIPTYGVDIAVRLSGEDFLTHSDGQRMVDRKIDELEGLEFTAINVGNPHIIAEVDEIDYEQLDRLGEKVKSLKQMFPNGVNISLCKLLGKNRIFVATYERGAGITPSCGTAMTSSATMMALRSRVDYNTDIDVVNRGGKVRCICHNGPEGLVTTLVGNATYESCGKILEWGDKDFVFEQTRECVDENLMYQQFLDSLN